MKTETKVFTIINFLFIVVLVFWTANLNGKINDGIDYSLVNETVNEATEYFQHRIDMMQKDIKTLEAINKPIKVTVTNYTASEDECDSTPHQTAIMRKPIVGRTVAVSHDLAHFLGKQVYIYGKGIYVVEDLMNSRYKKRIDILVNTKKEAYMFGTKKMLVVFLQPVEVANVSRR